MRLLGFVSGWCAASVWERIRRAPTPAPAPPPVAEDPFADVMVNDRFWLGWARDGVEGAADVRTRAGERLTAAVGWFWTVYTAIALVGAALLDGGYPTWVVIVVALPIALLAVAYLLAIWVTYPRHVEFDTRVPAQIEAAYVEIGRSRARRMRAAAIVTGVAAASVIAAGMATALVPSQGVPAMAVEVVDGDTLAVAARVPGATSAVVEVRDGKDRDVIEQVTLPTSDEIRMTVPLAEGATSPYTVRVSWTVDATTHTLGRTVTTGDVR